MADLKIVYTSLIRVNKDGVVKTGTSTLADMEDSQLEMRVMASPDSNNSLDYPNIKTYIEREYNDGRTLRLMNNTTIVTDDMGGGGGGSGGLIINGAALSVPFVDPVPVTGSTYEIDATVANTFEFTIDTAGTVTISATGLSESRNGQEFELRIVKNHASAAIAFNADFDDMSLSFPDLSGQSVGEMLILAGKYVHSKGVIYLVEVGTLA